MVIYLSSLLQFINLMNYFSNPKLLSTVIFFLVSRQSIMDSLFLVLLLLLSFANILGVAARLLGYNIVFLVLQSVMKMNGYHLLPCSLRYAMINCWTDQTFIIYSP